MTTERRIVVQIDPFCDCKGCIGKVKKALGKLDDVILLAMDPHNGIYTILTTKHPQVIEYALKHQFPNKNITLSQQTTPSYSLPSPHVDDIATTLLKMSRVQGLGSMEYTQSTTFKLNFTDGHNQQTLSSLPHKLPGVHLEHAPPPPPPPPPQTNIKPSAPPIPTTPDLVYGYPPEFYGYNKNYPHGYYTFFE